MAILNGTGKADKLKGTAQTDLIFGGNGDDMIDGGAGSDFLFGDNGNDILVGGAGSDVIDGGNGQDTLVLTGNRADYRFQPGLFGTATVRDLRPGAPDGTDILIDIERVQFKNGVFKLQDLLFSNVAPVAGNDALTLSETAGKTEIGSILLANDSDPDGDGVKISSVQAVSAKGAVVSLGADGKVSYDSGSIFAQLDNGETATDSFSYTISDGKGHSATATATVTITGVTQNSAPVAVGDTLTLAEDAGKTDVTAILLGNDGDPDGDAFQITAVQAVSARGAVVSIGPDGKVSYDSGQIFADLEDGQTQTDTFTYTITDSGGLTSTATATVTITGVTSEVEMPEWDAAFIVAEDGTRDGMWSRLADAFDFAIVAIDTRHTLGTVHFNPAQGLLAFAADHASTDSLNWDMHQDTWFTVIGAEGQRKVVGMRIEGNNDAIIAVDDAVAIGEGQTTGNLWSAMVSNEIDPDGSVHWHRILAVGTAGTQGVVTFDAGNRSVTYSAAGLDLAPGETLVDSFTYIVDDSYGATDTATVFVTVTGTAGGGATASMAMGGGDLLPAAFLPAGGQSHIDDDAFASFPAMQSMQEMLGADAAIG